MHQDGTIFFLILILNQRGIWWVLLLPHSRFTCFMTESIWLMHLERVLLHLIFRLTCLLSLCAIEMKASQMAFMCQSVEYKRRTAKASLSFNEGSAFPERITKSVLTISWLYNVLKRCLFCWSGSLTTMFWGACLFAHTYVCMCIFVYASMQVCVRK